MALVRLRGMRTKPRLTERRYHVPVIVGMESTPGSPFAQYVEPLVVCSLHNNLV